MMVAAQTDTEGAEEDTRARARARRRRDKKKLIQDAGGIVRVIELN
jgi:hypothetical protein